MLTNDETRGSNELELKYQQSKFLIDLFSEADQIVIHVEIKWRELPTLYEFLKDHHTALEPIQMQNARFYVTGCEEDFEVKTAKFFLHKRR